MKALVASFMTVLMERCPQHQLGRQACVSRHIEAAKGLSRCANPSRAMTSRRRRVAGFKRAARCCAAACVSRPGDGPANKLIAPQVQRIHKAHVE